MAVDIGPRIGIDGEKEFRQELQNINQQIRTLGSEMKAVTSSFEAGDRSEGALAAQTDVLNRQIDAQKQKLQQLQKGLDAAADKYGEADTKTLRWAQAVNEARADLNRLESQLKNATDEVDDLGDSLDGLDSGSLSFDGVMDAIGGLMGDMGLGGLSGLLSKGFAVGTVISGITQITGAITGLVDKTAEYRKIMGTLETSSQAAGYTAEQTAAEYQLLYSVLGDNQTAATATANLQAIGLSQEDLITITNQAIGAWATYGDSIPIDSLAESVNETIRAGTVTGTFADVLNWGSQEGETFGVTMRDSTEANKEWNEAVAECKTAEDYFNLALQDCQTEAERADLVMQAMANQGLQESADAWKENNQDIIDTNNSQAEFEEAQARLAEKLTPVKDALTDLGTLGFNFLADTVDTVSTAVEDLISWWDDLMEKIRRGWNDFWGIEEGSRDMSSRGGGFVDGSHAKGLNYVPWDGYIARLHKGEMVVPSRQAAALREAYESATATGTSLEGVINNAAAGMVNGLAAANQGYSFPREIVLKLENGAEIARWLLPYNRMANRANPEVLSGV